MTYGQHDDLAIDAAIQRAWTTHPYYASALSRLRIVADENVPTMATSKHWVTHYNPATVAGWTVDETAAVLVHELEHLLRQHDERCGTRDHQGWNVVADAEINQRLPGLPAGAVYPSDIGMPDGVTAETMYAISGQGKTDDPGQGDPEPGDGQGDGESGNAPGTPAPGNGPNCGSAAGGPVQDHEVGDAANPGPGAYSPGDVRKAAAREIVEYPGLDEGTDLREWAEAELGIDRASWYGALAAAVGHTMAPYGAPTRWRWPGRRDPNDMGGAVLPRWTGERPACAVIIDTSGSVTDQDIAMARAAGHFIGRVADARYYGCDTRVRDYGSTLPERIVGGGGTDLRVGIERAIADGARAVVVITDCMTPWPTEPTNVPLIIGANPSGSRYVGSGGRWSPPEWATVLPIMRDPS